MIGELQERPVAIRSGNAGMIARGDEFRTSVAIQAERRRILNALLAIEYMDIWLTMPGIDRLECRAEQQSPQRFSIDMFVEGVSVKSIYGSCLHTKTDEITYLLERSLVRIRLRCGPRKCSVHLQHVGLSNSQEREWYAHVWSLSLTRLRGVMERSRI